MNEDAGSSCAVVQKPAGWKISVVAAKGGSVKVSCVFAV